MVSVGSEARSGVWRHWPAVAGPPLAAGAIALVCLSIQWSIYGNERTDTRIYHRALRELFAGNLYEVGDLGQNFVYPPIAGLLLWPITLFDIEVATRLLLVLSIAAALWSATRLLELANLTRIAIPPVLIASMFLLLSPTWDTLWIGQINAYLAALVVADLVLIARGHPAGGALIGLAAAIKLSPAIVIVGLGIAGWRRAAATGLATAVIATLVAAVVVPSASFDFWTDVVGDAGRIAVDRAADHISLRGTLVTWFGDGTTSSALWWVAATAIGIASLIRMRRLGRDRDLVGVVLVACCLGAVVSPLTWIHHLWFVPIAVVVMIDRRGAMWVAALGGVALSSSFAVHATQVIAQPMYLSFCVLAAVMFPRQKDFPSAADLPQNGASFDERGTHV